MLTKADKTNVTAISTKNDYRIGQEKMINMEVHDFLKIINPTAPSVQEFFYQQPNKKIKNSIKYYCYKI